MRGRLREACVLVLVTGSVGCSLLFAAEEQATITDAAPSDGPQNDANRLQPACGSIEILAGEFHTSVDLSLLWQTFEDGLDTAVTPVANGIDFVVSALDGRAGLISYHAYSLENSRIDIEFETLATAQTTARFRARNSPNGDDSFSVSFVNSQITVFDGLNSTTVESTIEGNVPTRWSFSHIEDSKVALEIFDSFGTSLLSHRLDAKVPLDSLRLELLVTSPFEDSATTRLTRITAPERERAATFCPISEVADTFTGPELSNLWGHNTNCGTADGELNVQSDSMERCFIASSKGYLFDEFDSIEVELLSSDPLTKSALHLHLDDSYEDQLVLEFDRLTEMLSFENSLTAEPAPSPVRIEGPKVYLRLSRSPTEVVFEWSDNGVVFFSGAVQSENIPVGPYKISLTSRNEGVISQASSRFDNLRGANSP